jgi:hypothetical protein
MERVDPIVGWPAGIPRVEPSLGPDRVHPGEKREDRARERGREHDEPPEDEDGGEHVDVSALQCRPRARSTFNLPTRAAAAPA